MKDVRIGLAGCGSFGLMHLRAFRAVPGAEIAAVYDPDGERAARAAREYGIPRVCSSLAELCAAGLDALDVVTTEDCHLEPTLAALRARLHVFVEKPLALDTFDCGSMIRAAREADRILMAGQILRFEPRFAALKEELAAGSLGTIVSMHARRNRLKTLLNPYGRNHPVATNGVHDIDLMLWYVGQRVRKVRGYGRRVTGGQHHDAFLGVIEFDGGALGVLEVTWLLPSAGIAFDDTFQLIGDRGVADVTFAPAGMSIRRESGFEIPEISYSPCYRGAAHGALRDELAYFCDCVRRGRQPEVISATEAKNAVRVALALIESAEREAEAEIREWD
jgi:UDP-N-acetylglucosamine 3-dehydrogenase